MKIFASVVCSLCFFDVLLLCPTYCQEQKSVVVRGTVQVPDSAKVNLAPKVDESRLQRGWGKLKKGMQEQEVEAILGRPTRIGYQADDNSTTWYYGKHVVVYDYLKKAVRYWKK